MKRKMSKMERKEIELSQILIKFKAMSFAYLLTGDPFYLRQLKKVSKEYAKWKKRYG